MQQARAARGRSVKFPRELVQIAGGAGATFAVAAAGSAILGVLPDPGPWETASAYLAPAGLAFATYWWIKQRR